ncbi:Hsp20/alpha crystallin family protein [Cupriavidus sp. AU9028]|uniref:Hsp20/alpha crystallin family protein n=1 Tax=Cupriavidus sp. AU9028 TaxID=2871157 RepID=UPI001C96B912|nr:Hsp20/alpha crystallin family protein [Cupriavidus sp. AU9028]MBY4896670.1 Hsp20/alpha crystallin family protein [Cupriavidus sp. AU9028]
MYGSLLSAPGTLFAEFDRLQRELQQAFTTPSSIRAVARGSFPAVNIGTTPASVEIYAFAPGIDPASLEVSVDRGLLTIAGQRLAQGAASGGADPEANAAADYGAGKEAEGAAAQSAPASQGRDVNVYVRERFNGSFRRVITLPEDVDTARIEAVYRDGVLRISVARREAAQPRRITVS